MFPLLNRYFDLESALAKDDLKNAIQSGRALDSAFKQVNENIFTGPSKALWQRTSDKLKIALKSIDTWSDIKEIRKDFIAISVAMIELAESLKPLPEKIYVQHCPMADSNKGADWLSREKEIFNPYFGSAMLKCGEVKRTIN